METLASLDKAIFGVLFHPLAFLLYGLITHFGRKVMAAATYGTENLPVISDYWRKNRINSILSIIGSIVGYGVFAHFPDFDKMAPDIQTVVRSLAFTIGFMADNMADAVGRKGMNKIEGGSP